MTTNARTLDRTETCEEHAGGQRDLAYELRDGLLQNLVAASMVMSAARIRLSEPFEAAAGDLLTEVTAALDADVHRLRSIIRELQGDAA